MPTTVTIAAIPMAMPRLVRTDRPRFESTPMALVATMSLNLTLIVHPIRRGRPSA
jgi:hypothetical protein